MNTLSWSLRGCANLVGLKFLKGLSPPVCPLVWTIRGTLDLSPVANHKEQSQDHLSITVISLKGSPSLLNFQALPWGLGSHQPPGCTLTCPSVPPHLPRPKEYLGEKCLQQKKSGLIAMVVIA